LELVRLRFLIAGAAAVMLSACAPVAAPTAAVRAAPAASAPAAKPAAALAAQTLSLLSPNGLTLSLASRNGRFVRGANQIECVIADSAGRPISDAKVSYDVDMTNMSHGTQVVAAQSLGEGHYWGEVRFMMPGPWRNIVTVERPGQSPERLRFDFSVSMN
jgi:hypothetical protein